MLKLFLLLCKTDLGVAIWSEVISRFTLSRPVRKSVLTRGGAKEALGKETSPKLPDDLFPCTSEIPQA